MIIELNCTIVLVTPRFSSKHKRANLEILCCLSGDEIWLALFVSGRIV